MSICHEAFFSEDVIKDLLELLKEEPDVPDRNVGDTISRRTAIDACESIKRSAIIEDGEPLVRKSAVKYVLDNLPSAEPQITRCKDCKHFRRWVDTNTCFCDITEVEMLDDDYCSRAERRTDEDN